MTNMIIDLSNYKETTSAHLEEGTYNVVVEDVEVTEARTGNKMIVLTYRVNAPGTDADGKILIDRLTQTEKAMFRTVGFMQAIGLQTPKKKFKINLNAFLGKHLRVAVEDGEPYQGIVKSEVRDYFKITKPQGVEESEDFDLEEDLEEDFDAEESSDDPNDYGEDVEPEKVAQDKTNQKAQTTGEDVAESDNVDTAAAEVISLDDLDLG